MTTLRSAWRRSLTDVKPLFRNDVSSVHDVEPIGARFVKSKIAENEVVKEAARPPWNRMRHLNFCSEPKHVFCIFVDQRQIYSFLASHFIDIEFKFHAQMYRSLFEWKMRGVNSIKHSDHRAFATL